MNSQDQQNDASSTPNDNSVNLIVNYIPPTFTEEQLKELFQPYGNISQIKIVHDKMTRQSLGYGFVKFDNMAVAEVAIKNLNGYRLQNKKLKVSVAKPPEKETKSNLYISGLPPTFTKEDLSNLVSRFGKVLEVRVLIDQSTSRCKGVGFARLDSQKSALAAIAGLTGLSIESSNLPLIVKFADTQSDKQRKTQRRYNNNNNNMQGKFGGNQRRFFNNQGNFGGYFQPNQQANNANFHNYPQQNGMFSAPRGTDGKEQFSGICLFVYHLPIESTEQTLFQLFSNYGAVTSAKIMRDLHTGRNKGFGFVNMANEQQAQAALQSLNGFQMGNKYLKVAFKSQITNGKNE